MIFSPHLLLGVLHLITALLLLSLVPLLYLTSAHSPDRGGDELVQMCSYEAGGGRNIKKKEALHFDMGGGVGWEEGISQAGVRTEGSEL